MPTAVTCRVTAWLVVLLGVHARATTIAVEVGASSTRASLLDEINRALDASSLSPNELTGLEFHHRTAASRPRDLRTPVSNRPIVVQPSVLAADIGSLTSAIHEVVAAGSTWVHVDITDGSAEAGRSLSSLGPASVKAVRAAAPELKIDVHLYVNDPEEHIESVVSAGADRITFQMEMMGDLTSLESMAVAQSRACAVAGAINAMGCRAGICIAPATPVDTVMPLVRDGLVDLVDVLTVNPGIGGQKIQLAALEKVRTLRAAHPELPYLLVDGGIDDSTASLAAAAGANALVSGSYLFRAPPGGMGERLELLERALAEHGD